MRFGTTDVTKEVLPLLRRIDFRAHAVQVQRAVPDFFWSAGRLGINDPVTMRPPGTVAFIEQLRPIKRKREALHVLDQGRLLALFQVVSTYRRALSRNRA